MFFVYLPAHSEVQSSSAPADHASHDQVLKLVNELGLDGVDLQPVFRSHPDPLSLFPFRKPYHYNRAGYAVVAEAILKRIVAGDGAA